MYLLIKIAQKVFSPLGIPLFAFAYLCIFPQRGRRMVAWLGLLTLTAFSIPVTADHLMERLEAYAPPRMFAETPSAPVIVVLGGTAAPEWGDGFKAEELAGSRLLTAFRSYKAGKAPKILVTSGIAYTTAEGRLRTEAEDMRDILIDYGVPEAAIIVENRAQTTEQNALYTAELLRKVGISEIILVTSAYHMQRAGLWFILQGLTVHPVGSGYTARGGERTAMDYMPSAHALTRSSAAVKEFLGLIPIVWKMRNF